MRLGARLPGSEQLLAKGPPLAFQLRDLVDAVPVGLAAVVELAQDFVKGVDQFLRRFDPVVLVRLAFIASRSDWHGGFCLGPRLMQMAMPMLVLPVAPWLQERLRGRDRRSLLAFAVFGLLCVAQQATFVVGEPFSFYQGIRTSTVLRHVDVFSGDEIYLNWRYSAALHLLEV